MEAKYSFSGFDGVFLTARVDNRTGKQKLVMTLEDESGKVLASDSINCIHTAVMDINLEQAIDAYPDEDKHVEFINAHTSENQQVDLVPSERFLAFKSWVQGVAEAGPDAFVFQSELEAAAGFAYPIASKLLSFVVRNTSGCLDFFFDNLEQCRFEGEWHEPSLMANLRALSGVIGSMTVEQRAYVAGCMLSAEYPLSVFKDFTSLPGVADYLSHKLLNGGYPVNVLKEFAGLPGIAEHLLIIDPELKPVCDLFIKGKQFYDYSIPDSLDQALKYGSVATLPELIAGKALGEGSYLSEHWFTGHSWDVKGTLRGEEFGAYDGQGFYLAVHGPLLSPDRIRQAFSDGLDKVSVKLSQDEFNDLFNGKLPGGEKLSVYDFEELITLESGNFAVMKSVYDSEKDVETQVLKEIDPFGHYIIRMPLAIAQQTKSDYHTKEEFLNNPLVQARAGTKQFLEAYFDKVKGSSGVGNWYRFGDASSPRARFLFVNLDNGGLSYHYLGTNGRFVGVARDTD